MTPTARADARTRVRILAFGLSILTGAWLAGLPVGPQPEANAIGDALTMDEVDTLVARVVTWSKTVRGKRPLSIAVVDPEGNSLGVFNMTGTKGSRAVALAKASTAAYFSSDFGSFTTRTAAFIIQDHFPPGVRFAPGGPLYGVQFSNLGTSDVNPIYFPTAEDVGDGTLAFGLPEGAQARIRGEPGGVAIYKNNKRVGAIGVDDGRTRTQVNIQTSKIVDPSRPYRITFRNIENNRGMERVVMKAAAGMLPDRSKRAGRITVDGFRLPYRKPVSLPKRTVILGIPADGTYDADYPLRDTTTDPGGLASKFVPLSLAPPPEAGPGRQTFEVFAPSKFPIRAGTDGNLTEAEVRRILWQGVQRANVTRAAIRRPIGLAMQCWVSVVDTNGEVLGVVRTPDATLFSYDVSVQKARTSVLFSDSKVAWSCRAIGQHAQRFYPAGQQNSSIGPIYQLQDGLSVGLLTRAFGGAAGSPTPTPKLLETGITVFPGGVPIYRNGVLIGGVGVSGDGVDQDDIVADFASLGFRAPKLIRCDRVGLTVLKNSLIRAVKRMEALAPLDPASGATGAAGHAFFEARAKRSKTRLANIRLIVSPPYVKYPRHPGPVTIRVD